MFCVIDSRGNKEKACVWVGGSRRERVTVKSGVQIISALSKMQGLGAEREPGNFSPWSSQKFSENLRTSSRMRREGANKLQLTHYVDEMKDS